MAKVLIIPRFFVYLQPYLTKVESRHDSTNHASMFLDEPTGKAERVSRHAEMTICCFITVLFACLIIDDSRPLSYLVGMIGR